MALGETKTSSCARVVECQIPTTHFSPEENARIISITFRLWTLAAKHVTDMNPHLQYLQNTHADDTSRPTDASSAPPKKRLCRKTPSSNGSQDAQAPCKRLSYTLALEQFLDTGAAADMQAGYIQHVFLTTAGLARGVASDSTERITIRTNNEPN